MEKGKFINDINNASKDKNNQEAIKLEDNIEYRFELTKEEALRKKTIDIVKNMLKEKIPYELISKMVDKPINEIKEIEKSMKD